jgi:hypothetical protein
MPTLLDSLLVLQAPHHDRGMHPRRARERFDVRLVEIPRRDKTIPQRLRDKLVTGERVGFFLLGRLSRFLRVKKDRLLAVQKNVGRFVKEGEPEMVVRVISETQGDDWPVVAEPPGRAGEPNSLKLRDEDDRDSGLGAFDRMRLSTSCTSRHVQVRKQSRRSLNFSRLKGGRSLAAALRSANWSHIAVASVDSSKAALFLKETARFSIHSEQDSGLDTLKKRRIDSAISWGFLVFETIPSLRKSAIGNLLSQARVASLARFFSSLRSA